MSLRKMILSSGLSISADRIAVFADWFEEKGEEDMAKLARYWEEDARKCLRRANHQKRGKELN